MIHFQASINLCNLPPWVIASVEFNENPQPLSICGVLDSNKKFFAQLNAVDSQSRRGEMFHEYMCVKFGLHLWPDYESKARQSLKNSYIRFLRGWGLNSNGIEGAVIKDWAHTRFGITPSYHKAVLDKKAYEAWDTYGIDRMRGRAHTNAIDSQLDLLFEFCQYELGRRLGKQDKLILYRGTHDADEYRLIETGAKRERCVRLNNISSFTSDREKAWEFGSTAWQVQVPVTKVFFFSELLPSSLLKGESEYLVIGGDYWVKELLF
jgi:NAD+--dinitrogen-reductase ADP-D-ribosyltransferase